MTNRDALQLKKFDPVWTRRTPRDGWRSDMVMDVEQIVETGDVLVEGRMNGWIACGNVELNRPPTAPVEAPMPDFPSGTVGPTIDVIDRPASAPQGETFEGAGGTSGGGGATASWDDTTEATESSVSAKTPSSTD